MMRRSLRGKWVKEGKQEGKKKKTGEKHRKKVYRNTFSHNVQGVLEGNSRDQWDQTKSSPHARSFRDHPNHPKGKT